MLNISPFSSGLIIQQVFDKGSIYNPEVLDIAEETLHSGFLEGVRNVASVCLRIGYPTVASVPHLSSMGTSEFWLCLWRMITPSHLLKRSRPSWLIHLLLWLLPLGPAAAAAPAKVEAKEESEELDEDMGFGLFD
ncbi:unnamed protein product [Pipistrellus nathusii]|uniref:Large ribosomal subunit protein uL10 n=1 Tax=Pipistrellus nathusii TaxID=59473 RepID=A0ABN9ZVD7_PIPNA